MSKNDKLNVSVTILHEMDNVQYKISGNLIGINENSNTCTIRFKNGRVESGIPMSDVYIAEGLLDTVKKYGKKFVTWLVKKVKGLVAFCNLDGKMDENCFFSPVNILAKQSNGTLPSACTFYPTQNIIEQAEAAGISVVLPDDNELSQAEKDELDVIERFWTRVMNIAGTTDKTVEESIKYVNEAYYHNSVAYNKLNEAGILTTKTAKDELGRDDLDGKWVNTTELKAVIKRSIKAQLQLSNKYMAARFDNFDDEEIDDDLAKWAEDYVEDESNKVEKFPVPLIWGAPGIGKTAIINAVLEDFKNDPDTPTNLYLYSVYCAGLDADSFRLPAPVNHDSAEGVKDLYFAQGIISWLPMYQPRDAAYNRAMEDRFARCMHISSDGDKPLLDSDNNEYQGGVLFLDEVVRVHPHAFPVIMNICDRGLQEMKLADSWAIICAANRYIDDPSQEATTLMEATPILQRFIHYTYVPEREEWLKWARETNKKGVANIDPQICDFIAAMPEWVWYRTVDNGGYDEEVKKAFNKSNAADFYKDGISFENIEALKDAAEEAKSPIALNKATWNGRTWERISKEYANMLKNALSQNPKNYSYPICLARSIKRYNYNGIDNAVLEEALDYVPEEKWKQWCVDYNQKYKKGLSGFERLGVIRQALIELVKEHCGSNNPGTAQEMKKYFDWQATFSEPEVIESIYNTGLMPKKYQQQDDAGRYVDGGFAWKDNTAIVREVESFLMKRYPNSNAVNDFRDYVDFVSTGVNSLVGTLDTLGAKKATTDTQKKIDALIKKAFECPVTFNAKKYEEYFTVHTGTKKYGDIQILQIDKINPVVNNIIFNMIEQCAFVRYLLNLVKYYIKIDYTSNCFTVIGNYREQDNFKTLVTKTFALGQSVTTEYQNVHNAISGINSQNVTKNPTISTLQFLDVFYLMKACLTIAFSLKTKERMSGKVSV